MLISYYYAGNFNVRCGNAVSGNAAVGWERMKTGGRACQRRDWYTASSARWSLVRSAHVECDNKIRGARGTRAQDKYTACPRDDQWMSCPSSIHRPLGIWSLTCSCSCRTISYSYTLQTTTQFAVDHMMDDVYPSALDACYPARVTPVLFVFCCCILLSASWVNKTQQRKLIIMALVALQQSRTSWSYKLAVNLNLDGQV